MDYVHLSFLYQGFNCRSPFSVVSMICFVDRCVFKSNYLTCCLFYVAVFTMCFVEVFLEDWPYLVSHGLAVPFDAGFFVLTGLENE